MNENIQALLQKIAESEELQGRFAKVSTPEEAYEVAKELQGGFTKEEFLEAAKALAEALNDDISDEDLASAAGGVDEPDGNAMNESLGMAPQITNTNKTVSGASITVVTKSVIYRSESKASKALAI